MMNAISERTIYIGIYLPAQSTPTTAAIMKLQRANNAETGSFAYGLGYLENPQAIAFHPDHFPLQRREFSLEARLLRDGGAMPLVVKDALPDAWGRLVISQELGGRIPADDELLLLTNDDRVGAMVFSEARNMPAPVPPPRFELADLAEAVKRLQYDMDLPKPLQRLLKRGGSLGGARPKASFVHDHRSLKQREPTQHSKRESRAASGGRPSSSGRLPAIGNKRARTVLDRICAKTAL